MTIPMVTARTIGDWLNLPIHIAARANRYCEWPTTKCGQPAVYETRDSTKPLQVCEWHYLKACGQRI
jgi:hypothetical protein